MARKLAAAAGYTVVPVASVGPDEYYDHAVHRRRWSFTAGALARQTGVLPADLRSDLVPPTHRRAGRPAETESTYFSIGKPIDLSDYKGKTLSTRQLSTLRRKRKAKRDRTALVTP